MPNHRTDPIRVMSVLLGDKRRTALAELEHANQALRDLDRELVALRRQRRQIAATISTQRRRLWPNYSKRGRQPAPDGSEQLPPARHDAQRLWGRRLRAACRAILAAVNGPVVLTELHAMLHDRGILIRSRHVVKALSDAMSYEVELGRVRRTARGIYQLLDQRTATASISTR